jgi:hypothetical protein
MRSRSPNRTTLKRRKIYKSPIKRGSITHRIFEGEDEYERIQELLNDPDVLVHDKISFSGNNQYNYWIGHIIEENGEKKLVNITNPHDDIY